MPEQDCKSLLSLLNNKKSILTEILRITTVTDIDPLTTTSGTVTEANIKSDKACEEYIDLYEKRKALFARIYEIDKKIDNLPLLDYNNSGWKKEIECVQGEIKSVAASIIELDDKNKLQSEKLRAHIQKSIKEINIGKLTRNKYINSYQPAGIQHNNYDVKQ